MHREGDVVVAGLAVDITMLGDKGLANMLKRLEPTVQRKILRSSIRKSVRRLRGEMVKRTPVLTGQLKAAMKTAKVGLKSGKSFVIGRLPQPLATEDAITANVLEYGSSRAPAIAFRRRAVNENAESEFREIAADMRKGVAKEAAKLARKR